jgi:hypothetical protein
MTQILINLESGPEGQLAGQLTTGAGEVVAFAGWLHLLRLLEDEVRAAETPRFDHESSPRYPLGHDHDVDG